MKKMGERPTVPAPTSFNHYEVIPHSGGGKHHTGAKLRGERPSKVSPTSYTHDAVTEPEIKSLGGHDKIPAKSSTVTPNSHFAVVPHSGPKKISGPHTSWKKKNYTLDTPSSMPAGETRNGGSSLS